MFVLCSEEVDQRHKTRQASEATDGTVVPSSAMHCIASHRTGSRATHCIGRSAWQRSAGPCNAPHRNAVHGPDRTAAHSTAKHCSGAQRTVLDCTGRNAEHRTVKQCRAMHSRAYWREGDSRPLASLNFRTRAWDLHVGIHRRLARRHHRIQLGPLRLRHFPCLGRRRLDRLPFPPRCRRPRIARPGISCSSVGGHGCQLALHQYQTQVHACRRLGRNSRIL